MAKDPVCGREVDEKNWVAVGGEKTVYKGKTYYFCRMMCRQRFIMNPEKYLKALEEQESARTD